MPPATNDAFSTLVAFYTLSAGHSKYLFHVIFLETSTFSLALCSYFFLVYSFFFFLGWGRGHLYHYDCWDFYLARLYSFVKCI